MLNRLLGAHSRDEQVAAARALDRTLLWQYYSIPNWYLNSHRLAYRQPLRLRRHPPTTPWACARGGRKTWRRPDDPSPLHPSAGSPAARLLRPAPRRPKHALTLYDGPPKYPADFKHFDYVNPDAPKGGILRQADFGGFDSLNPFIGKGVSAPSLG